MADRRAGRTAALARRHPHLLALGVLGLTIGALYLPVLVGARSLITDAPLSGGPYFVADPLAGGPITAPLAHLVASAWGHLQLPVNDPFQGYGVSLLANQGTPVYPPEILAHLLVPGHYSDWNVANLVLLAFGAYLLARSLGQRWLAAVPVGLVAALAGPAPPNVNLSMLDPLALTPFLLLALRHALDPASRHRRVGLLGVATSVTLLALSGFPEVLPLLAVTVAVYAAAMCHHFATLRRRPGLVVATAGAGLCGLVAGGVGLWPTLAQLGGGATVNPPDGYLTHVPAWWLATLTVPSVAGPGLTGQPADLGLTVWTLGTPLLVVVLVLSVAVMARRGGRPTRWYGVPSAVLTLLGVLAYADAGHLLVLLHLPVFEDIFSVRFVQFAWWLPWCLLLGLVVSGARALRAVDVLAALAVGVAVDLPAVAGLRHALAAHHLGAAAERTAGATALALVLGAAFCAALLAARRWGDRWAAGLAAVVVLGSCAWYLPTAFFPAGADGAPASLRVHGPSTLAFFGAAALPWRFPSVQVWGPIDPVPYHDTVSRLFPAAETVDGLGVLNQSAPAMGFVAPGPTAVSALRYLGVDTVVSPTPLTAPGGAALPSCGPPAPAPGPAGLCDLGPGTVAGGPTAATVHAYRVEGAAPLVVPVRRLATVPTDAAGRRRSTGALTPAGGPPVAYVTGRAPAAPAAGVRGLGWSATTESVTVRVTAAAPGVAVLRAAHVPGMTATVDGRAVPATAVDGGLWTAVPVPAGRATVVLDYVTGAERVEFAVAFAGLVALGAAWLWLAARSLRRRTAGGPGPDGPPPRP